MWLQRSLIAVGIVLLVVAGVFYILGRGRVEVAPTGAPPGLGKEARLQTVVLYFGDPDEIGLRPEERTIAAGPSLAARLAAVVRELAAGSFNGALPVVPPETQLRNAFVDPWGVAYLDFDRSLLSGQPREDGEEWLAIASIVRTVCDNYPEVRRVRFMIDGQAVTSLAGTMDLEEPLDARDFPIRAAGR
jgi:hypothetical protein